MPTDHSDATTPTGEARRRVLIVDDNENVVSILYDFLTGAYTVDTALDAARALKSAAANPPDLILLDVNMPGTDGLTLLGSLRQRGLTIPIFVITGYDQAGLAQKARQLGATQFLVKPVDLRKLDALIAEALGVSPIV
jgi:two-component system response regulator MprA